MNPTAEPADGLPLPRRYWSITAIILAIGISVLDSTIVNVALPTIARDLGAGAAASIWVVNAYQLAILMLLLPFASLGEIVGYRRVAQAGVAVFTLASLACAAAPTLLSLCLARVVQGIGAAGIMSCNPALVRYTYPQRMLGRAVGLNAFVVATAAAVGPSLAAAILAVTQWRWLFAINLPLGIATLAIGLRSWPESDRTARTLNLTGAVLYAAVFGLLLSGLQALAHDGGHALALGQLALGGILAVALVQHERPRAAPLIPFDLLRRPLFTLSVGTSIASFTAQMSAFVAMPFELQRLGHSAVTTGLYLTAWPVALGLAAPLAGRLADRYPAGILGSVGLLLLTAGLLCLALIPAGAPPADWIWRLAVCGFGFGFFQAPNNRTLIGSAPRSRSGAAGGMLSVARIAGQTLGAASVAILFRLNGAAGSHRTLYLAAALALCGAVVSLARLRHPAEPSSS